MKKLLTVFVFLFWLVSIASAGELITGAFGIKLGEPLDLNLVQSEIVDETDYGVFLICNTRWGRPQAVRPKITNKLFHSYFVFLTPTTKTVTRILAYGSDGCGVSEIQGVKGVLEEKYGEQFKFRGDEKYFSNKYFSGKDRKGRYVALDCGFFDSKRVLIVEYQLAEEEINETLSKEQKKLDMESSDPSGL